MDKKYGEFKCPVCSKDFFIKKKLDTHMGHHARNYTGNPKCKKCKVVLNEKNWPPSLKKSSNLLCRKCLKVRNRDSYMRKKKRMMEERGK